MHIAIHSNTSCCFCFGMLQNKGCKIFSNFPVVRKKAELLGDLLNILSVFHTEPKTALQIKIKFLSKRSMVQNRICILWFLSYTIHTHIFWQQPK